MSNENYATYYKRMNSDKQANFWQLNMSKRDLFMSRNCAREQGE